MSTPPGWYPDPSSPTQLRWWDGSAWSEQTAPRPEVAPTPAPASAPSPWPRPGESSSAPASASPTPSSVPPPPPPPYAPNAYTPSAYQPGTYAPAQYPSASGPRTGGITFDFSRKASYFKRIVASSLDWLFAWWPATVGLIVTFAVVGAHDVSTDPDNIDVQLTGGATLAIVLCLVIGFLTSFGLFIWNQFVRQGRTGQSLGKKALGLALVSIERQGPCGGWRVLAREAIASGLGGVSLGLFHLLDVLWPLWDRQGQRIVDKMLGTCVVPVREH